MEHGFCVRRVVDRRVGQLPAIVQSMRSVRPELPGFSGLIILFGLFLGRVILECRELESSCFHGDESVKIPAA
ncbi:hypothetical protein SAMN04489751_0891 [Brevibacterium sandarakinum]|uniref:Uncharacterized protein n=1 Tax=Brevibacterium sandarakinum TaxID=629680 RepID=A0A1H1N9L8_BRESA|nr:hypothetical protein SAMN04489751_0891 [Brevibacterium sandarakinum]